MLFNRTLLDGIVFSVLFGLMITIIEMISSRLELHNYPLAIRKIVEPKTEEEQKKFKMLQNFLSFQVLKEILHTKTISIT